MALAFGLAPILQGFDMKMIVSPTLAGMVFVGTQVLCVAAGAMSFHKVAVLILRSFFAVESRIEGGKIRGGARGAEIDEDVPRGQT